MGFWDDYKEPGGGTFITGDERKSLAKAGTPMQVKQVRDERSPFTNDDGVNPQRYVLTVTVEGSDEDRQLSFDQGSVGSRDQLLGDILRYQEEEGGELPRILLEKAGRAWLVKIARDEAAQF